MRAYLAYVGCRTIEIQLGFCLVDSRGPKKAVTIMTVVLADGRGATDGVQNLPGGRILLASHGPNLNYVRTALALRAMHLGP